MTISHSFVFLYEIHIFLYKIHIYICKINSMQYNLFCKYKLMLNKSSEYVNVYISHKWNMAYIIIVYCIVLIILFVL